MATTPTPSAGQPAGDLAGRLLASRYRLNRPIASGGMAQVWEATDQILTRRVAVKLLHTHLANDESFVKRFRAEAIAAARLAHPSIVSVYDTFSEDGLEAIVMELVVGTTMRADLDEHGPLRLDAVLAIGTQVADALGAAHASGLVHRDVKPANILLSADGRVLVADFGIAKAAEGSDMTSEGSMVGTAKYLAPEQVEGTPLDGRADLYALGVVLYEALTGVAPFVAETDVGTAFARLHRDATPARQLRPQIPPAVEAVVARAMQRRREDRYPDARTMRAALLGAGADPGRAPAAAAAAAEASSGEYPVTHGTPPPPPAPRPPAPPAPSGPAVPQPGPSYATSAPPVGREAHAFIPTEEATPVRRTRWGWWILVAVACAVVLGVVATALSGGGGHEARSTVRPLAEAAAFDPVGGDGEHPDEVPNAIDDDPATTWQTEHYGNPDLAAPGQKGGVGIEVRLDAASTVTSVDVTSPDAGWTAQVYAVDGTDPTDLAGWGKAADEVQGATKGTTHFALAAKADRVLIWFTKLPTRGQVAVGNVVVKGR